MGNEVIDLIIQYAEEMRLHGHDEQLVAMAGKGIELDGLAGVNSPYGEISVYQHPNLVAPNTLLVVTQAAYQEILAQL